MSAEIIDEQDELLPAVVVREASPTLFGTTDPTEVVEAATKAAKPLADVVKQQKLFKTINGKHHVLVEGWTLLGSMLGVYPICIWTRELENGWEARVEARTRDGSLVGAAEAECLRSESLWAKRDDYALRSMAQTRATSKALRMPLGFVMQLAGFEGTPADEIPSGTPPVSEVDYALEADIGELIGLSDALGVREAAQAAIEHHRLEDPQFAKWVQAQLAKARDARAKAEAA